MAQKTIWVCDGCDAELVVNREASSDWKAVRIELSGFMGYPTCAKEDPVQLVGHLCPACAKQYYFAANPRQWPRPSKSIKPPETQA